MQTVAATTLQTAIFTAIEPPTNRGAHVPAAAILKGVDIQIWGADDPPVEGRHRCLMVYRPAATVYADPIAAWLDQADPLTEEAIQIRQHKMGRMEQFVTRNPNLPPYFRCRWRGNISLRDGDDIVLALQDDSEATLWIGLCTAWWIA